MNTFSSLTTLVLWLLAATHAAMIPLPGVMVGEGRQQLPGRFAFLYCQEVKLETNSTAAAAIYALDLCERKLAKITDAPAGLFYASEFGDLFCVVFRPGNWFRSEDTNVFIFWSATGQGHVFSLERPPQQTRLVAGHAFFVLESADGTQLVDYDIARRQKRLVELPGASKWQYQHYDSIHVPRGQTNVLHFYYKGYGDRRGDGKDYPDGYYSLEIQTGELRWFAELLGDQDDEAYTFRTADGRYVFFEGEGGPMGGFRLVSSPWDFLGSRSQDPKGRKAKLLKAFPRLSLHRAGAYLLSQISPDGRFVLVRLEEPCAPMTAVQPGWKNTYFVVDASGGDCTLVLKDEVARLTRGWMSVVRWIR